LASRNESLDVLRTETKKFPETQHWQAGLFPRGVVAHPCRRNAECLGDLPYVQQLRHAASRLIIAITKAKLIIIPYLKAFQI
jgi:hypothetical protein